MTKSKLCILPLEGYMKEYIDDEFFMDGSFKSTQLVFNRNGCYYNKATKKCWFEYKDQAFLVDPGAFQYRLDLLEYRYLTEREVRAYKEVVKLRTSRTVYKEAIRLLREHNELMILKDIYRSWSRFFFRADDD